MKRVKHNKIKNTGILFELLLRQVTADIFASQNQSKSVSLIKEYFNKKTALGKELELYQLLVKNNYKTTSKADYLISVVSESRNRISNSKLRKEKYNLIKEIKDSFNVKDFFQSQIPNYKVLASIYKLFEYNDNTQDFNPAEIVSSKCTILEHLTSSPIQTKEKDKVKDRLINEYRKQGDDLRLLSYKILVEKFNKKYSVLGEKQRLLLKEYINNISNTNGLDEYISTECKSVQKELKNQVSKITEKVAKIKVTESLKQINSLVNNTKQSVEDRIVSLMRYYELNQELNKVHSE